MTLADGQVKSTDLPGDPSHQEVQSTFEATVRDMSPDPAQLHQRLETADVIPWVMLAVGVILIVIAFVKLPQK